MKPSADGLFHGTCAICQAEVVLPFTPYQGRPVFCREHMITNAAEAQVYGRNDWRDFREPRNQDRMATSCLGAYKHAFEAARDSEIWRERGRHRDNRWANRRRTG